MYTVKIPNPSGERPSVVTLVEKRYLEPSTLINLCIRRNWFTCGTNEQYEDLLRFVRGTEDMTTGSLYVVATRILDHSETDQDITSILYDLAEVCITTFEIV